MPLPDLIAIHDTYLTLSRLARERFAGSLGGSLLLQAGFDSHGAAVLSAGGIAGAASLCVDADAGALRQGMRTGLCDFVVSHLDEALRILKNELRRRRPVSVCLATDPRRCLAEMIERGVQPDLVSADSRGRAAASDRGDAFQIFVARGADLLSCPGQEAGTSLLFWKVAAEAARTMPQIAAIAAEALDGARDDTPARMHWLTTAPRWLGRAFGSRLCLRMAGPEAAAFVERMREEWPAVLITRDGAAA